MHTNLISEALKRNIGTKNASEEILAFIDPDARPEKSWLRNAIPHFRDPEVAAVGGPGITPPEDSLTQKASSIHEISLVEK